VGRRLQHKEKQVEEKPYTMVPEDMWGLSSLNTTEMLLLISLYRCHQNQIKTSRKSLARQSRLSLTTVNKGLSRLESLGFISKEIHKDEYGCNLPSTFTINEEAITLACKG
jgi:DNA-binding MarR family transcriptional regulator